MSSNKVYGRYKATVVEIEDPEKKGRVRVSCLPLFGKAKSAWCSLSVPFHGDFHVPPVNAKVWVEFEEGDLNKPIITGSWYEESPVTNDYAQATQERVIGFGNSKVTFTKDTIALSIGEGAVEFVKLESGGIEVRGLNFSFYDILKNSNLDGGHAVNNSDVIMNFGDATGDASIDLEGGKAYGN